MHPLEPLTADEIGEAVRILRGDDRVGGTTRFAMVVLHEPPKDGLEGADREAHAVLVDRADGSTAEAVVSLTAGTVRCWTPLPGCHAAYLLEEMSDAIAATKADPRWLAALAERGVTDIESVQLDTWPAGHFGIDGEEDRRLVRVISYVRHEDADNGYAHPVEGVVAVVDVAANEVVRVEDHGVVPVPADCHRYDPAAVGAMRSDLRPIEITQPEGPSFEIDGNAIRWQRWRLRVSMHPLDGLVLHTVGYQDGDELRPVLHRASLAEMVVPYGEVAPGHYWKNAFDSGELALGRWPFLNSLELGCDCLGVIHYLDAVQVTEQGDTHTVANAICIHEEDFGILWKHVDIAGTFDSEVRRSRRLVISSIHTVGNYEYGFYWHLYLDGTIELQVKLTGILQTMGMAPGERPAHGQLVAPGVAAPHHQHLFCFRLDFDVDGVENAVEEVQLDPVPAGDGNPWGNAMAAAVRPLARESDAQRVVEPSRSRHWRVVNRSRTNAVGDPVAYRLVPGAAPTLLAHPDSFIAKRAAFATRNLWVTPYAEAERRAAGYPSLSPGGQGLPEFTAGDRPVDGTDVVLWYTFGVNHLARTEDWPVMPVEYVGFTLSPFGFFDRNPALDVPH